MLTQTWVALLVTIAIAVGGFAAVYFLRRRTHTEPPLLASNTAIEAEAAPSAAPSQSIPYSTEATEEAIGHVFKLAFGVARFDYQIFADHAVVLELVERAIGNAAEQHEYFPRRPLLLPKLLQALNDEASTRQMLVRLILEDPALAGATLKRANNAFYRMSAQPVESLDRAVALLGVLGLRGLVSTAILQPVFRLPKGFFDRFADIAWEQAQRCAASAQRYSEMSGADDPFVAQLLGLLRSLANLVLFRMTLDKYKRCPNVLPRPEVFVRIMQQHGNSLALEIAKTWQLLPPSLEALEQQVRQDSPTDMSALGRAVYYGQLAGVLTVATQHHAYSHDGAQAMLIEQGLSAEVAQALLQRAAETDI